MSPWVVLFKGAAGSDLAGQPQSARVYPQTIPHPSKNTRAPRSTIILPHDPAPCWFTASVHTPYKHIILMSSSRPASLSWRPHLDELSTSLQLTPWNISHNQASFLQKPLHLCLQNIYQTPILVYLEAHSLSGVNVYLKSHKWEVHLPPF